MITYTLDWPVESAQTANESTFNWHDMGANRVLDFHGDPVNAGLSILSDGNHHMALLDAVRQYLHNNPHLKDIFYVTLPPQVLNGILQKGAIQLGNLIINIQPDVYIGPEGILQQWHEKKRVDTPQLFARSKGLAWLIRKGNPTAFSGIQDLMSEETRFFISNPVSEKASYQVYHDSLCRLAEQRDLDSELFSDALLNGAPWVMHGRFVHHREAPEAVASKQVDVTLVYYHLALRYTRIFPDSFDMIPLPGSGSDDVAAFQEITGYAIARVSDSNTQAADFCDYMKSETVANFYHHHGLQTAL